MGNSRSNSVRAQEAGLQRRRELLMIEHIEQSLAAARAVILGLSDQQILDSANRLGSIVENPFRAYVFRERGSVNESLAKRMLEATYTFNVERVVRGELPEPVGPTYRCTISGCRGHKGLLTFDKLRDHTATCIAAAHAAGIPESDPWSRFVFRESPNSVWTRSEHGVTLVRRAYAIARMPVSSGAVSWRVTESKMIVSIARAAREAA